ncbi:hypothetical protein ABTY98_17970 [Streptomyces sp. NPDC096040]
MARAGGWSVQGADPSARGEEARPGRPRPRARPPTR